MQQEDVRKTVAAQFYKSLNERGVQVTAIPSDQLDAMVAALADSLFAVIDTLEGEDDTQPSAAEPPSTTAEPPRGDPEDRPHATEATPGEEVRLWKGRPYLTIGTRYEVTSQRIRIYRGILGNTIEEIELIRVKDTKVKQHVGERMLNVGDITVFSADPSTPDFVLHNVRHPIDVRELIRKAVLSEKERRGMYYREDIGDGNN